MIRTLPFADYRALDAWGSSDLKAMREGPPARVLWKRENPSKETDATIRGTAAHSLILTPDLFASTYIEKPEGMEYRSNENKAWRDGHLAAGRKILSRPEWVLVHAVRDSFMRKLAAEWALRGALSHVEQSVEWNDPVHGEPCKGRPDFFDAEYVYDLKVTVEAGRLAQAAFRNGWLHQLAHYRSGLQASGLNVCGGRIVAVHPDAPHYVYCVEAKEADLDLLALENENTVRDLKACREAGHFPGTPDEWTRIAIPQFAIQESVALNDMEEVDNA